MASSSATTYDPFGLNGGSTTTAAKGTARANSTGGSSKSNAGVQYDPFNISNSNVHTPIATAPKPSQPKFMPAAKQSLLGKARSFVNNDIIKPTANTAAKAANTVAAGGVGLAGLDKALIQKVTGNNQGSQNTVNSTQKTINMLLSKGAGGAGAYLTPQQAQSSGGGTKGLINNFVKPTTKAVADIAPLVVPIGSEAKGANLLIKTAKTSAANAVVGAGSTAANEAANGKVNLKDVGKSAAVGGVLGAVNEAGAGGLMKGHEKIANSDNKVVSNAKAVVGNSAPAKSLIQNQKTQTLLHYEPKNPKVQALIADREKQAEAMNAPAKAAEAEQSRVANETEKTQATGQKIDRQVQLIKAKKADNAGELSNVDQVKLQHLQEDKKQLPTTSPPTVEKVPGAITQPKVGNDVTPAKVSSETKPVVEFKEPTPKAATVTEPVTTKAVVDPNAPPEKGTSKIAQDIQTKAVAKNLTDNYGELSQYNKINVANEADKAVKFVNGDKEDVMKVISGEKPLPSNLRATAVIKAVEEHPEYSKDGEVLKALAKSPLNTESSRSAQELRLAAERDQNSAVNKINELSKTREDAFKTRTGKTVAKATNDEVRQIREAVPKVATTKETFSSFVDSLKC